MLGLILKAHVHQALMVHCAEFYNMRLDHGPLQGACKDRKLHSTLRAHRKAPSEKTHTSVGNL